MSAASSGSSDVTGGAGGSELVAAIVPAAGLGERLGRGTPKAFAILCDRPMVAWSLRSLARSGAASPIPA